MLNTKNTIVILALALACCGGRPVEMESDSGADTANSDATWWLGSYSYIVGDSQKSSYLFELNSDGTLSYTKDNCSGTGFSKTGSWELSGDGETVELLNDDGTAPFVSSVSQDDGEEALFLWREGSGPTCDVRFGPLGTIGEDWTFGALCLADGSDCYDGLESVYSFWCSGAAPEAKSCP